MASGTVKWFNPTKGYGFIVPDDGSYEVYVSLEDVSSAGIGTLLGGQKVLYELADAEGKSHAVNLRTLEATFVAA